MPDKRITFTVPSSLHQKIKLKATRDGTTIKDIAISLFKNHYLLKSKASSRDLKQRSA